VNLLSSVEVITVDDKSTCFNSAQSKKKAYEPMNSEEKKEVQRRNKACSGNKRERKGGDTFISCHGEATFWLRFELL